MAQQADLVLEGGGVKGIALLGAIALLEERGYTFPRVAGSSAGAIVGALVAAGVPTATRRDLLDELDPARFADGGVLSRLGLVGRTAAVLTCGGVHPGRELVRWLRELLADHGVRTFEDLRRDDPDADLAPDHVSRLVVLASDVSHGALRRLPWEYARYGIAPGSADVATAIRASAAIPFYFRPTRLPDELEGGTSWLVDGGLLSNFPVGVFDRRDRRPPRWPTFGIKLSSRADALQGRRREVRGPLSLTAAMLATMSSFHDRLHLEQADVQARTIFVDTSDVRATDFDIDAATRRSLYERGRRAAARFLDGTDTHPGWDHADYLRRFREHEP